MEDLTSQVVIRFLVAPRDMRGQNDAWNPAQRVVLGKRLMLEHIQRGLHIPAGETLGKRTLFDDLGARGVDEQRPGLDMLQRLRGDDAFGSGE